jgi:hypothetical protein
MFIPFECCHVECFWKGREKFCFRRWADYVFELSKDKFYKQSQMFFFFGFRKQLDPQVVIILCAHLCLGIKQFQ